VDSTPTAARPGHDAPRELTAEHESELRREGRERGPHHDGAGGGESTGTVIVALLSNAAIMVAKAVAAVLSGSAAMAAETAHSFADTGNELILLTAIKRSEKPADRSHPFGYGKERYFWSLIAAVSIFVSGAVFSIAEGVRALLASGGEESSPVFAYVVLALGFVFEGISWVRAVKQTRQEAAEHDRSVRGFLTHTDDPTVKTVAFEDSAALIGLTLAFLGVLLHQLTGSGLWDALASFAIGLLLCWAAFVLARTNKNLLIGSQADPRLVEDIQRWLCEEPEVVAVAELLTMRTGTDRTLVCARIDFDDRMDARAIEQASLRLDEELHRRYKEVDEVFLEAVPHGDEHLQRRIEQRYQPADDRG
jgi:cation diffusion facilitator family transporter